MAIQENTKSKLPHFIVTILFALSIWLLLRATIKYFSLWFIQLGFKPITIPILIGNPLNNPLLIEMYFSFIIFITMWLLSTRVNFYQEIKMRIITFTIMLSGVSMQFLWNSSVPVFEDLIPYIINHQNMIFIGNTALEHSLFSNTPNLMLFLLSLPTIFLFIILTWLVKLCNEHWGDLIVYFKDFQYNVKIPGFVTIFMNDNTKRKISKDIKEFFDERQPDIIPLPDVALGPNQKTNAMVIQRGKDRTLNNLIIGAIGTGKTSALVLPIINQDLHHMTYMINNYKKYYNQEGYHSEDIKGRFLNGISVIEPSKDLCDKTFQLVKAHGIPEEVVFYIDPTNPDTPSLNLFKGPTDKVAEMFTMVVSGIGESQEFFFEQSQRSHLKHHIYLLKEHDPETDVGFEDLINMYNDAQLVASMHLKLKSRLTSLGTIEEIDDRDQRNHLLILKGISDWFDMTYVPVDKGFGKNMQPDIIKEGPYRGQQRVEDKKSEHVVGLRNILNDIASNILLRRVLFGKSDFDFDKHLEYGGILLVNTAKGELSSLSDVLGKFCLLSLQNAVFRRKPNDSPFHHILVDEFPDYINEDFGSFPAQSRKYKAIITVVAQTVSQLQRKYGPDFMTTLIATLRNKMVYGDGTQLDAEMFSTIFGEKYIFEESESDQEVSPLMDSPNRRTGKSYTKTERAVMTVSEMIYQDAFVAAVKLVEDNKPLPAQQVEANFVPKEEFNEAVIQVNESAANYWLDIRRNSLIGDNAPSKLGDGSIQDAESVIDDEDLNIILPNATVNKPLNPIDYKPSSSLIIDQSSFFESPIEETKIENKITKNEELLAFIEKEPNTDEINKPTSEEFINKLMGNPLEVNEHNVASKTKNMTKSNTKADELPSKDLEKTNVNVKFNALFDTLNQASTSSKVLGETIISKDNPFNSDAIKPISEEKYVNKNELVDTTQNEIEVKFDNRNVEDKSEKEPKESQKNQRKPNKPPSLASLKENVGIITNLDEKVTQEEHVQWLQKEREAVQNKVKQVEVKDTSLLKELMGSMENDDAN